MVETESVFEKKEIRKTKGLLLAEIPGDPLETLLRWTDGDVKATPLKALQGLIWEEGYHDGTLLSHVFPDVPPALGLKKR